MKREKNRLLYVVALSESDVGPATHVNAILDHTSYPVDCIGILNEYVSSRKARLFPIKYIIKNTYWKIITFEIKVIVRMLLRRREYSRILLRNSLGFFLIPIVGRLIKTPVLTEVNGILQQDLRDRRRNGFLQHFFYSLERLCLENSALIICVHENIRVHLRSQYPRVKKSKLYIVENGYHPPAPCSSRKLCLSGGRGLRIGYLGSFAVREGVDLLPSVSNLLLERRISHQFNLIGGGKKERSDILAKIADRGLEKSFNIHGIVDHVEAIDILRTMHVCVHLRRPLHGVHDSQGCPLKILDYIAADKYIVATKLAAYDFIENLEIGVLVEYDDRFLTNVCKALEQSLVHARDNKASIKRAAFLETKSWKSQVKKIDALLRVGVS